MASTSTGCARELEGLEVVDSPTTADGSQKSELYYTAEQTLYVDAARSESEGVERSDSAERRRAVEERIERSKCHWSELDCSVEEDVTGQTSESQSELIDDIYKEELERVRAQNVEAFKALQSHPTRGQFFRTFGYDLGVWRSYGELKVGEKFAEGGQAELFHADVTWRNPNNQEYHLSKGTKWVLKVFKHGTLLQGLQSQWPEGMLQYEAQRFELGFTPQVAYTSDLECGTLLDDGRFAFLMERETEDLRNFIDHTKRLRIDGDYCGPFSKKMSLRFMYRIARGMEVLHNRDIIHRDLKASNVLVTRSRQGCWNCLVADYECSVGVIGTRFWKAPEILQACKDRIVSKRLDLFTKEADAYSYGMTCYEILTGKLPFQGEEVGFDNVISGQCPQIPQYVDARVQKLLCKCWESEPLNRPSFGQIIEELVEIHNSYHDVDDSDSDIE